MSKKWLSLSLVVSLLVAGYLLFGSQSEDGGPEEGVLRVWVTWGGDPAQIRALFERYRQQSGQPVKVTLGVDSDRVLKTVTGPAPPELIVLSSSDMVKSYYEQGWVEPLDPWIKASGIDLDDIYPAPLAQCATLDGTNACLPWGGDIYALFWNKELFAAAGLDPERPPQTMEQLVATADQLTIRDEQGKISQIGFIPDLGRSHADLYARLLGGFWTNDDGTTLTVNSQPMIDAANWQRQFYAKHGSKAVRKFVASFNRYMNSHHPYYAGRRLDCQQCHRHTPPNSAKMPDHGFYAGQVAMMIAGEWQVGPNSLPHFQPELNYGVAPFPPPADHPERANTTVVQGPVVILPAGVQDKAAAAKLLAWMMSPEVVAAEAYANANLPTSRTAAQDPRFQQIPNFALFMELMAHPNAQQVVTTPISLALNEALGQVEQELLHEGGDPVSLLNEVQAELAPMLKAALAFYDEP
jgi:multiple sugar transport system substrate-binding protein